MAIYIDSLMCFLNLLSSTSYPLSCNAATQGRVKASHSGVRLAPPPPPIGRPLVGLGVDAPAAGGVGGTCGWGLFSRCKPCVKNR